ncbi:hypothetical protein BHM03_00010938 [Ensete ventricosum]|nr:hypothetical protein BHM03_00010938 [Ensete ventricosum]
MRNQPVTIDFDRRRPISSGLNQGREKEEEEWSQLREGERRRGEPGFLPASHDPLPAGDFFSCAGRRNVSPHGDYKRGDASHDPSPGLPASRDPSPASNFFSLRREKKRLPMWGERTSRPRYVPYRQLIDMLASVHTPGSGYVLLHHVMGETDGERGVWSYVSTSPFLYVEGGMGSVSLAISNAACEAGVHVVTNAEELVPPNILTEDFLRLIKNIDYSSFLSSKEDSLGCHSLGVAMLMCLNQVLNMWVCQFQEAFAQSCFSLIDEYAPGFSSSIIGYDMLTPPDLEREFGLTGKSDYRTPVKGLYLCGSGTHPGGGVMGAPGRNAASVVIDDMKKLR